MTLQCPLPERLSPPEEPTPHCSCCGREADYCDIMLTEAERIALALPAGVREVHLCGDHDEIRRDCWGEVDDLHQLLEGLAIAAGVSSDRLNDNPELLAVRIGAKLPYHHTHNPGGIR